MTEEMNDIPLIKILFDADIYNRYASYVQSETLTWEVKTIINSFETYFQIPQGKAEWPDFVTWFLYTYKADATNSQKEIFNTIFSRVSTSEYASAPNVVLKFKELELSARLNSLILTKFDVEQAQAYISEYTEEVKKLSKDGTEHIENDLSRISVSTSRENGLPWRLQCLTLGLNQLIKGDFGIIAGFVDVGKSTLAISEATYMAQHLTEGCVLWLNNEEFNDRILKKMWQSVLNAPWEKIIADPERAKEVYTKKMHGDIDRIKLIDIRNKKLSDIQLIFKTYNPSLVVIDQIDKISVATKKHWGEHDRLKQLYGEIRSLANSYCPVLAISQTDASVRWLDTKSQSVQYQRYIDQSQLDGSKVGKPGEADFIITIGQDTSCPNSRFIHIPKNKLDGIDDTFRKIKAEVLFNGRCSRYENP